MPRGKNPLKGRQYKAKLTEKEIQSAYEAAVNLLCIAGNYRMFGKNADYVEEQFGVLITALQKK